jgi:hypothetical protein
MCPLQTLYILPIILLQAASAYISDRDAPQPYRRQIPKRIPTPPFPDGPCGGRVVTIPGEELFKQNNSFLNPALNPFASWRDVVLPKRDVGVWLPKEYDLNEFKAEDFPVLYCHDGQNGECILQIAQP